MDLPEECAAARQITDGPGRISEWAMLRYALCLVSLALLGSCGGENTKSKVSAPGTEETAKSKFLEAGASLMQHKTPIDALNTYLDGFHFYNGAIKSQMEAHHYCGHLNEEMIQCVIFDGNGKQAKLMGVEYIISGAMFAKLPAEEKRLWHSHVHEVRSGQLIAPGIPDVAEHELMEKVAGTYGKTWHTWHTDKDLELPLGTPLLMMGFTQDGQADEQMIADRDKRFDVSSAQNRTKRADISYPPIDPGADTWQKGETFQLQLAQVKPGQTVHVPAHAVTPKVVTASD
jgi:Protein of unknown function (DUF1264)